MTLEEVNKQSVIIEGVTYTPKTKCVRLKNGEADYTIIKSAQEVYLEIKNKIDICPPKTVEERLAEAEQKLAESEEEKKLLKAQVEVLSNTTDFHEELIAEMASKVYA